MKVSYLLRDWRNGWYWYYVHDAEKQFKDYDYIMRVFPAAVKYQNKTIFSSLRVRR